MNQTVLQTGLPNYSKPEPNTLTGQYCVLQPFDRNVHASALYEAFLLDKEWFHVKTRIKCWLDSSNFNGSGHQIKRLSEF